MRDRAQYVDVRLPFGPYVGVGEEERGGKGRGGEGRGGERGERSAQP